METKLNCGVCIRECEIGKSFCHRRDGHGKLVQANRFNAVAADRLFDKPIAHFGDNSKILSVGSWGCNLRCLGCQNVNLSWNERGCCVAYIELNQDQLIDLAIQNGCKGICFTYNEPAIMLEAIEEYACAAKRKDLFTVMVTNSTLTKASTKRLAKHIDAVAADIKSMNDEFYRKYCGAEGIDGVKDKILDCIQTFVNSDTHVEIRTNIIPGGNDQYDNYYRIASWIKNNLGEEIPWHITRFFPANQLNDIQPTSVLEMEKAKQAGLEIGLRYVHTYYDKGCDCAKEAQLLKIGNSENRYVESSCCSEEKTKVINFNDITF